MYADGSIYEGQFSRDHKHGYGCFLSDGRCRFGKLKDDRFLSGHVSVKTEGPISDSLVETLKNRIEEADLSETERTALGCFLSTVRETPPDVDAEESGYITSE